MVDTKKLKLLENRRRLESSAEYSQVGYKKGIPVEKGVVLNEEYLRQHKEEIGKTMSFFTAYPDLFLDLITPEDEKFQLFFYQRIFLRAAMRFKSIYLTAARAFSKSFLTILALMLQCIFIPGRKVFICAPNKNQGAQIAREKITEIYNAAFDEEAIVRANAYLADLNDVNMIDPYHFKAYNEVAINYNRDVENFPVLNTIFEEIYGESPYKSPTDMGVNMAGFSIIDDEVCKKASHEEIIRRYFSTLCDKKMGQKNDHAIKKIESLMNQAGISVENTRPIVKTALLKSETTNGQPALALELPNGQVVTGKTSDLLGASSAAILNALKVLAILLEFLLHCLQLYY